MSEVKVNKISPRSGTALTVGDGGDTVTVTGNDIRSDAYKASDGGNLVSQSGTTITLGASGDTINVASGATLVGGGIEWQSSIVTASTLTAVAGRGYWIDTSSNTCTITLPGSASAGDQLIFVDYARNWGTNKIIIDSNGLNYQGNPDTYTVEYNTSGETLNIVYSGSTNGWIPLDDDAVADPGAPPIPDPTQKAVFAFGTTGGSSRINTSNLVSSSGVVASNTTGVGTARNAIRAASYSTNKAIFAFGTTASADTGVSNLVSSSGVVATDTSAVGTARNNPGAAEYGNTLAIFAFGGGPLMNTKNLVSSAGVIASDATGVGTARSSPAGTNYGGDKAIFVFGYLGSDVIADLSNLVSNTGVVASDTTGVGTQRTSLSGNGYGGDKAIIAFGNSNTASTTPTNLSNLISNTGVVASDTAGVGESRYQLSSTGYSQTA